jgi:U3 small nucleolar RNA-associated protein 22
VRNPNFVKEENSEGEENDEVYNGNSNDSDSGVSGDVSIVKNKTKKRKNKSKDGNKAKKSKSDEKLTAEEINELKETEDLYHSSLFRMQIDETLKEVRLSGEKQEFIKKWLSTFKKFLSKLPAAEISGFAKNLKVVEGTKKPQMTYKAPEDAILFGSHALETNIDVKSAVDVLLIMPAEFFHKSDYVNQMFIHKRAIYLSYIGKKLMEKGTLGGNIKMSTLKNDSLNPVLILDAEEFRISVTASPPEDFFKLNRFIPVTNNIKPKNIEESITPTPHYNFQVLFSSTILRNQKLLQERIAKHENIKNALKLIKIWLHQREFDAGFHGLNGFILSCYFVHLLRIKKIYPTMSCYQIVRLFWNHFGHSKLDLTGISLCSEKNLPNQVS